MKAVSGKRLRQLLLQRGWEERRIQGSHHIFAMAGCIERITVPIHGNTPLKIGLQRHLMKLAGIQESEL